MFLLRDLIKLPGKQGGTFLSHCVITSVKACWVFLAWWIYFSSRYAIHLHPLLKLGWFVFFTFRRGVGGLWQSWEVSFGCASHAGYQKLKTKMFFHYVVCFSVWESACMWLFFLVLQLFWDSASTWILFALQMLLRATWQVNRQPIVGFRNLKQFKLLG